MRKTRLFRRCGGAASLPHVTGSDTSTTSALIDCRPATTQETLPAPSSYQGEEASAPEGRASQGKWWHRGRGGAAGRHCHNEPAATVSVQTERNTRKSLRLFSFLSRVTLPRKRLVATILLTLLTYQTAFFEETA